MPEDDEFSFSIGEMLPGNSRARIKQMLATSFIPTDSGEEGRDYYCPLGRSVGVSTLLQLKQSLIRENGDVFRFDIQAPISENGQVTLTNVIIELK